MKQKTQSRQSVSSSSPSASATQLTLSPLRVQWQVLFAEQQWLLKQIKKKRTEWRNFLEQMRFLAIEIRQKGRPVYQAIEALDREIHALFHEILTQRQLEKKTNEEILSIYQMLQFLGMISSQLDEEDEELDELFGAENQEQKENHSHQEEFFGTQGSSQEEPAVRDHDNCSLNQRESGRQLRKTFLRLAEIFHPDKVTDTQTQMHHTEIMKEVNRAYKEGDVARLLEIERSHSQLESLSLEESDSNDLEKKCQRLKTENQLLQKQYDLLKKELRLIRKTPEGAMVKDYRKAVVSGIDPLKELREVTKVQVEQLKEIRNLLKDFLAQKITIKEFLERPIELAG